MRPARPRPSKRTCPYSPRSDKGRRGHHATRVGAASFENPAFHGGSVVWPPDLPLPDHFYTGLVAIRSGSPLLAPLGGDVAAVSGDTASRVLSARSRSGARRGRHARRHHEALCRDSIRPLIAPLVADAILPRDGCSGHARADRVVSRPAAVWAASTGARSRQFESGASRSWCEAPRCPLQRDACWLSGSAASTCDFEQVGPGLSWVTLSSREPDGYEDCGFVVRRAPHRCQPMRAPRPGPKSAAARAGVCSLLRRAGAVPFRNSGVVVVRA